MESAATTNQSRPDRPCGTVGCGEMLPPNNKTGWCRRCYLLSPDRRQKERTRIREYNRRAKQDPAWKSDFLRRSRVAQARMKSTPLGKIKLLVSRAAIRARAQGLPHGVTLDDLLPLPTVCPVLGVVLDYTYTGRMASPSSASLDRIVPKLGYVRGNVRIVSHRANTLKRDATPEELYALAMDYLRLSGRSPAH